MIKAIIFDCFGVIIADGFRAVLRGLDETKPEARAHIVPLVDKVVNGELGVKDSSIKISGYLGITHEQWREMIKSHENKDPKVLDLIKTIHQKYKTAMLSNVGEGGIEQRFTTEELANCFDVIVASGEVGFIKPQPEIYLLTAKRLGVEPSECVFIDDIERFCTAAKGVGMETILYQDFEQMKTELEKILAADPDN